VQSDDRSKIAENLQGVVERVTFHSEETGFCVLRVRVRGRRELATVVGRAPVIGPGEMVECAGRWINDSTHGLQFRAEELRVIPPSTKRGIEKYLSSGMVRGIGPHFAKKLVHAFGEHVFDVIENEPQRLQELPGIGPKRSAQVTAAWSEQRVVREIMVFLQSHGVGTARAVRIYKTYGDDSVAVVRDNPYKLALDVHGIGFRSADRIASSLGVPADSPLRARAGVRHVLLEMSNDGHCTSLRDKLVEASCTLLEITEDIVESALDTEIGEGRLVSEEIDGERYIYLAALYASEVGVASHMNRLMRGESAWKEIDTGKAVPWVEGKTGLTLSMSQKEAVALALRGKVAVITGGPGVGKTTLVNSLLQIVLAKKARVLLCAPTGRAAKRLGESAGIEAKTIHRLLEFDPHFGGFKRDRDRPLKADLIVLDEASMVDVVLMNQLLRAIPDGASFWIIGDVDQIPSVGPGTVLADIIRSEAVPTVRLTEIFRQAAHSRIIVNAHRINQGKMPLGSNKDEGTDFYFIPAAEPEEISEKLLHIVLERIPTRFGYHPVRDVQVLTPMNRGGLGARSLNVELQKRLNPGAEPRIERFGWTFAPGDKVIQTVNNYDKEVFNGDIGTVEAIDPLDKVLTVDFDRRLVQYDLHQLDEISLAYAITIHKSQGSEYPVVVIPLAMQHYLLLERNLLYTGVTRGKNLVVVIGQQRALGKAVGTIRSGSRRTHLLRRLRNAII